jgi:hypothetical protein
VEWFGQQLFVTQQNAGFVSEFVDLINISPVCRGMVWPTAVCKAPKMPFLSANL